MSEMLANRYFLAARFADAASQFEAHLRKHPGDSAARKKLVVCYALCGRLREALELAAGLLGESPDVFVRTDPRSEGFPCRDVQGLVDLHRGFADPGERFICLGLLHLFCDEPRAEQELRMALDQCGDPETLRIVHDLVLRHMEERHVR